MTIACPNCDHLIEGAHFFAGNRNAAFPMAHSGGLPTRILDLLSIDGPLTTAGIALRLDSSDSSIRKAIFRLRSRGLVEGNPEALNGGGTVKLWRLIL